jgi:hypothetical protein
VAGLIDRLDPKKREDIAEDRGPDSSVAPEDYAPP